MDAERHDFEHAGMPLPHSSNGLKRLACRLERLQADRESDAEWAAVLDGPGTVENPEVDAVGDIGVNRRADGLQHLSRGRPGGDTSKVTREGVLEPAALLF